MTNEEILLMIVNDRLVRLLKEALKVSRGIKMAKDKKYFYINMAKAAATAFLDYIGSESPVKCYNYKFDYTLDPTPKGTP
ncbi:MAG: hypothetical protein ACXAEU_00505 [Candidatus Hodarchaeales archaeon]|jgi:hypothetical protein